MKSLKAGILDKVHSDMMQHYEQARSSAMAFVLDGAESSRRAAIEQYAKYKTCHELLNFLATALPDEESKCNHAEGELCSMCPAQEEAVTNCCEGVVDDLSSVSLTR